MSLLAFSFFLAFIWIAVEVCFFIGWCANLGGDLNIPKNSRVNFGKRFIQSRNLRTVFDGYQSLKSLDVSMVSCHHYQKVRN